MGSATRARAARLLTLDAAEAYGRSERCDMEAGMAKYFASKAALRNSEEAMRIHGGYAYSKEYEIERYYRDALLMCIGPVHDLASAMDNPYLEQTGMMQTVQHPDRETLRVPTSPIEYPTPYSPRRIVMPTRSAPTLSKEKSRRSSPVTKPPLGDGA